jgi:hypothetical protein
VACRQDRPDAPLGLGAVGLAAVPSPASAAPINCSVPDLKTAIDTANGGSGGAIDLPPLCTITLDTVDNDSNAWVGTIPTTATGSSPAVAGCTG